LFASALWVVNLRLPDMLGTTFLRLVRRRLRSASVFLVSDEYARADELAARSAGATAYFCKPPSPAWLEGYCLESHSLAMRATRITPGEAPALRPP
jgi:DNA-binding response OmpR family regulator